MADPLSITSDLEYDEGIGVQNDDSDVTNLSSALQDAIVIVLHAHVRSHADGGPAAAHNVVQHGLQRLFLACDQHDLGPGLLGR